MASFTGNHCCYASTLCRLDPKLNLRSVHQAAKAASRLRTPSGTDSTMGGRWPLGSPDSKGMIMFMSSVPETRPSQNSANAPGSTVTGRYSSAIQAFQSQNRRRWTVGIGLNLTSARKPVCYEGIKTERSASQHAISAKLIHH